MKRTAEVELLQEDPKRRPTWVSALRTAVSDLCGVTVNYCPVKQCFELRQSEEIQTPPPLNHTANHVYLLDIRASMPQGSSRS